MTGRLELEYAVRGADLVDEMRAAGQLTEQGAHRRGSAVTLDDVGLNHRRVAEWRSLRDNGALAYREPDPAP